MEKLVRLGRAFYGLGLIGIGSQQFIYSDFRPFLLAFWPNWMPPVAIFAYLVGAILIVAGGIIIVSNKARMVSLALGGLFLFFFLASHVFYQLFLSPNSFHFGSWTNALKALAFAGGAFLIASSYPAEQSAKINSVLRVTGRIFFGSMLTVFGWDHYLYTEFVATLVPAWLAHSIFWTYFGCVALMGAGLCIILKLQIRLVSILLGIMLLIWFFILHIPRAIADPNGGEGNEITSVFQALAFSGIAFVIASIYQQSTREKKM